jgi:hypothetical protein
MRLSSVAFGATVHDPQELIIIAEVIFSNAFPMLRSVDESLDLLDS